MGDHYVLGFALRFLQSSPILSGHYKSRPLDETRNQGPPCQCQYTVTHTKRSHTHVKDLVVVVHVRVWWI